MRNELMLLALRVLHNVRKVVSRSDHADDADHHAGERDQDAEVHDEGTLEERQVPRLEEGLDDASDGGERVLIAVVDQECCRAVQRARQSERERARISQTVLSDGWVDSRAVLTPRIERTIGSQVARVEERHEQELGEVEERQEREVPAKVPQARRAERQREAEHTRQAEHEGQGRHDAATALLELGAAVESHARQGIVPLGAGAVEERERRHIC